MWPFHQILVIHYDINMQFNATSRGPYKKVGLLIKVSFLEKRPAVLYDGHLGLLIVVAQDMWPLNTSPGSLGRQVSLAH